MLDCSYRKFPLLLPGVIPVLGAESDTHVVIGLTLALWLHWVNGT